jgi:hypothetical protein
MTELRQLGAQLDLATLTGKRDRVGTGRLKLGSYTGQAPLSGV